MARITVIPAEGRLVRNPATRKNLPPEGAQVNLDTYWIRRIEDGDVTSPDYPPQPA